MTTQEWLDTFRKQHQRGELGPDKCMATARALEAVLAIPVDDNADAFSAGWNEAVAIIRKAITEALGVTDD